ncbi:hypothetical protein HNP84_010352 [Thermocatellispora tengchongensis]|uniref:Uncharacterized protein n=1 Tax=Thermocatellispora tengchongensis TaxID=1073253 RepID=A0A840PR38_9ACTN|nr:hypothetical protein [Thermocatellispora tengchongensis]MBB5140583.1 hypothetical protein [Thermocatellispora tengchongensis]
MRTPAWQRDGRSSAVARRVLVTESDPAESEPTASAWIASASVGSASVGSERAALCEFAARRGRVMRRASAVCHAVRRASVTSWGRGAGWAGSGRAARLPLAADAGHEHIAHEDVTVRADRRAWFAADGRRTLVRAVALGALMAAGWLIAVLLGLLAGAAPASADTFAARDAGHTGIAAAVAPDGGIAEAATTGVGDGGDRPPSGGLPAEPGIDGFPLIGGIAAAGESAAGNAEAMAGRGVDGLTSQSTPVLPAPSTADVGAGADGFVPHGGGGPGQFGPGTGDVARSTYDPHVLVRRAPLAAVLPPVVRTAADEPSFSPD